MFKHKTTILLVVVLLTGLSFVSAEGDNLVEQLFDVIDDAQEQTQDDNMPDHSNESSSSSEDDEVDDEWGFQRQLSSSGSMLRPIGGISPQVQNLLEIAVAAKAQKRAERRALRRIGSLAAAFNGASAGQLFGTSGLTQLPQSSQPQQAAASNSLSSVAAAAAAKPDWMAGAPTSESHFFRGQDIMDSDSDNDEDYDLEDDTFHHAIKNRVFKGTRTEICEDIRKRMKSHWTWKFPVSRFSKKKFDRLFDKHYGKTCSRHNDDGEEKTFIVKKKQDKDEFELEVDTGFSTWHKIGGNQNVGDMDSDENHLNIIRAAFAPATRSATCQKLKMGLIVRLKKRLPSISAKRIARVFARRFGRFCGVDEAEEKDSKHSREFKRVKVSPDGNSVSYSSGFTWSNEE